MIKRILLKKIKSELNLKKAIVILGARQVGKTTLLNELCNGVDDLLVFNGDDPETRSLLSNVGPKQMEVLFKNKKTIVIDEAQRIPNVGITLKIIIDQFPEIRLYVSGSSSLDLANEINEPLTGRKIEHQLFPVSFKEMVDHHGLWEEKLNLQKRLVFGYYPEILTSPGKEILLLKNLAGSYLYRDILSFGNIKKPIVLDKLLKALALQIGGEVSYHELGQMVSADKETVEKYIDLLEKAFIIFKLDAFSRNIRNEIKKGKKIYFYDNGIRNALIGNFQSFDLRTDKGALWENFIISERIKYLSYSDFYGHFYFWRTTQQQEIDFIEEIDGKFKAFEFKYNKKKTHRISKTFTKNYNVEYTETITPDNIESFLLKPETSPIR